MNRIGLDKEKSKRIAEKLNGLLANYSVFYQNVRGYHWNIKGNKFFELHDKFQELYEDLFVKIDEVAERIKTLGHIPNHKFSDYQKDADIKESDEVSDGIKDVKDILESFKIIIWDLRGSDKIIIEYGVFYQKRNILLAKLKQSEY